MSTTHRTDLDTRTTGDAQRVERLRSLVADDRYDVDRSALAAAVVRRIGPLLVARELPPRSGRPHLV